ncbi:hypothetical protein [Nocardia cyriacigeorgica]
MVGGVNLTLLPHTTDYLAEAGFLSPEGRCAPFDRPPEPTAEPVISA